MLGMIIVHAVAIILGVYANKFIGGSLVGMLNILFSAEMVLYFAFELFARVNYAKSRDGFFYSGLAMVSLIVNNIINVFYR